MNAHVPIVPAGLAAGGHAASLKNRLMKYVCPLPVIFGVLVILVTPAGSEIVRSLISNSPISIDFWVGML